MATTNDISIEFLSVDDLKFDPINPRLPGNFDGNNETEVLRWMLADASLTDLMGSIGQQGYFPGEPLLGFRDNNGNCIVVEGNRRLGAAKLLLHPELAPDKKKSVLLIAGESPNIPNELPVIIYPTRESILSYLGYRHVTGVKPWEPLAKARYLQELYNMELGTNNQAKFRILAKKIGSRADYVARLLTGYAIYKQIEDNDFFGIKGLDEDSIDFSILTTAMNYTNFVSFLGMKSATDLSIDGLDLERLKELTDWLFARNSEDRTRIGESRNLSLLSKIVANDKAIAVWRSGESLEYASMLTETPAEIFQSSIAKSRDNLVTARNYSHYIEKPESMVIDSLREIGQISQDLCDLMNKRLTKE